jgi:Uma2 family endonuclease
VIAELVPIEQYLQTRFEHDAELVEGRIVERSMPTWEHSRIQAYLAMKLGLMERAAGFFTVTEQRVRTRQDRFRVPDVCVVFERPSGTPGRRIVTTPPWLCVEILSPEDTAAETLEKVQEYAAFGVEWIWIVDPVTLRGEVYSHGKATLVSDGIFSTDRFHVDLNEVEF